MTSRARRPRAHTTGSGRRENNNESCGPFFFSRSEIKKMVEARSAKSERYAFKQLGLGEPLIDESALVTLFEGTRVPEGIFADPLDANRRISVEVKRIIGGHLPAGGGGRRVIRRHSTRRGDEIIWPWTSSVEAALTKLSFEIMHTFDVSVHHVVFLVPESMPCRTYQRTARHIQDVTRKHLKQHPTHCKIRLHIISGADDMFERL